MCWVRNDVVFRADRLPERHGDRRVADASTQRVSDADRQRVVERLRTHTAEGRLTLDEFEDRVGEALHARTFGDLDTALRDLPTGSRIPRATRATRAARATRAVPAWMLHPFVMIGAVIALVSLAAGNLIIWPLVVAVAVCAFGGCGQRRTIAGARHTAARPRSHDPDDAMTMV